MPRKMRLIKKDLWKLLSDYIKQRDKNKCWLCGKIVEGSNAHCSHILPKGLYERYAFEEWNLKTLCMDCHLNHWHKNPLEVALMFKKMYPSKYKEVLKKAEEYNTTQPYSREILINKIEEYKKCLI